MKFIEIEKYKIMCILEQSELFSYGATLIDSSSADAINGLIMLIESSDEVSAREVIRSFEENVRKNMMS